MLLIQSDEITLNDKNSFLAERNDCRFFRWLF